MEAAKQALENHVTILVDAKLVRARSEFNHFTRDKFPGMWFGEKINNAEVMSLTKWALRGF